MWGHYQITAACNISYKHFQISDYNFYNQKKEVSFTFESDLLEGLIVIFAFSNSIILNLFSIFTSLKFQLTHLGHTDGESMP